MSEPSTTRRGSRPTVVDVARHANVSQGTVSRYLNGLPIREDNLERVEAAIRELRYTRNAAAHAMRSERSQMVGLLVPDYDEFHARLLGLLSKRLRQEGISTLVMCHAYSASEDSMTDALGYFQAHSVDAVVISGTQGQTERLLELGAAGMRIITYDNRAEEKSFFGVTVNNRDVSREAVQELIRLGHRKPAIITGELNKWTAQERLAGWREAFGTADLPVPEHLIVESDWTRQSGRDGFASLWEGPERPSAVFASNHQIALGIVSYCRENGIVISRDLSLISFDDIEAFQFISPPVAAISQPVEAIAEAIRRLVLLPAPDPGAQAPSEELKCGILLRDSVAARPSTHETQATGET